LFIATQAYVPLTIAVAENPHTRTYRTGKYKRVSLYIIHTGQEHTKDRKLQESFLIHNTYRAGKYKGQENTRTFPYT
jgi:hypothetical protein